MTILVTGAAGFIGCFVAKTLLERGEKVIGLDNLNDYYDVNLKHARLALLKPYPQFQFIKAELADKSAIETIFQQNKPTGVIHLAAQAGVRYSLTNPHAYIDSNITGFLNILEGCRHHQVKHLVYASSSSVYGANTTMPFSIHHNIDHPVSLYAATKKSNELMAHAYSHLYQFPSTGLRFFTVYGPWGRPDMALFLFTQKILADEPIDVFNYGHHKRDFTYIDDIVTGVIKVFDHPAQSNPQWSGDNPDPGTSKAPWRIYNIGNHTPIELLKYIEVLENCLGKTAKKNLLPLQPGDVPDTYADVEDLVQDLDYRPNTSIETGITNFVKWYRQYYQI